MQVLKNVVHRGQRLMQTTVSKICIMHLSMLILSWEVGLGERDLGKGWGFDLKAFVFGQMPQWHHIWWKENKFTTPPIMVRLEVKCVSLKAAKYQLYFPNYLAVNIVRCSGVLRKKKKENSFLNLAWYIYLKKCCLYTNRLTSFVNLHLYKSNRM